MMLVPIMVNARAVFVQRWVLTMEMVMELQLLLTHVYHQLKVKK